MEQLRAIDDSIEGRDTDRGNVAPGREMYGVISASLGAMRPLAAKLAKLLLAHPNDEMSLLSDDVKKISSYVDQLSEVEDPSQTEECWMNEARDLSYDMEDYIDNLLFVQPAGPSLVTHNETIAAKVLEFSKYVQEAIRRYKVYVLQDSGASSTSLRRRFVSLGPMLPTLYKEIVIDGRMNQFINSFAKDGEGQLKVVSVLGSACLGKTTLARVLYNKLGKQYNCRAFVRVSRKPDTKRIFRDMLSQLQVQDNIEYLNEIDLIDNIKKYLRNKSYLIIIDDVWATSVWDIINHVLPKGSHGSRIVTTTQIEDVALTCCCHQSKRVFEMKPLDDYHSRELFFNRTFGSESDCPELFKEVSNNIVEMCGGLPLATISIASLLASQPVITKDLLKHIHESLSFFSSTSSTSERTRQALHLSFNNLPQYLRTFLLYLSMYPQGYTFYTDNLVKQWMAEGFIDTTEGQDMEKVAESYLHQLIGRRFIQPMHINYNNEVLSCAVHDAVHDLITHKSAEENFIVAIDYSQKNVALSHKARRLSLLVGDARYAKTTANITKSQLRSLIYFGLFECMPSITEFKLLRVLVLQVSDHGGEDNPVDLTIISELIQLRYLKIGGGLYIKLPTGGSKYLETLDIRDAVVISVSWHNLRPQSLHLSLPFVTSLLDGFVDLRHYLKDLYLTSSTDPYHLGENMKALGCIISFNAKVRTVVVMADGSMVKNSVVRGELVEITTLDDLSSQPPLLLQRFECLPATGMTFYRIPKWVKDLDNLRILKISVKELRFDCVDILRTLHALTALSLYVQRQSPDGILFDKAGFSALNHFKLTLTSGIAWLIFRADAMPNLWKLRLVFNSIPPKNQNRNFFLPTATGGRKQIKSGNALITIEHMQGLREISAKFIGAAADLEHIKERGINNDQSNPEIDIQYGVQNTKQKQKQSDEILVEDSDGPAAERSLESLYVFTLDELTSATGNFSRAHFDGDDCKKRNRKTFCRPGVYEGSFEGIVSPGTARQRVVVKCVNKFCDDREWLLVDYMELECLSTVRHPHLVRLLGFCDYYGHRMLVYSYMPKKSLKQYLFTHFRNPSTGSTDDVLAWLTRLKIAVGVAKGLSFLHEADKPMAHCDFSASNILLDLDHTAILFGYRFAKENPQDKTPGTLTVESDIYNFGVVLLVLLAGRPAVDDKELHCLEMLVGRLALDDGHLDLGGDLVEWSRPYLCREDRLHHIIDPTLKGQYTKHAAWSMAKIVRRCLHGVLEKRPSMHEVVEALEPLLLLEPVDDKPSQIPNADPLEPVDDKPSQTANADLRQLVDDKPSQTPNANNEARAEAGNDDKAGSSRGSQSIQLDVNGTVSSRYPTEWVGRHEFTVDELMSATSNFSEENLLGEADFGHIYKGAVARNLMVAVMKLRPDCDDWLVARAWLPELQRLESMRHPHLVSLLGCCDQNEQCVLVYEYMPRGSLAESLSDIKLLASLPWLTRLKIAVGAAMGLNFLHSQGNLIYYTGFTASSILLASDHTAKLWGFGLAEQSGVMVQARTEIDVYNFGMVLLELLAGRSAVEKKRLDLEMDLDKWLSPSTYRGDHMYREGRLRQIMDPSLEGQYSVHAASRAVAIAWQCLKRDPAERPAMRDVVELLEPLLSTGPEPVPADKPPSKETKKLTKVSRMTKAAKRMASPAVKGRGKGKQPELVGEPTTKEGVSVARPDELDS